MSDAVFVGPRLQLGLVSITARAQAALSEEDVNVALLRHHYGDWGTVGTEDWQANDEALKRDARILSSYIDRSGEKFWIITEADRSATTVLLPRDY